MKSIALLLFCCLSMLSSMAQTPVIDSMYQLLPNSSDSLKVKVMEDLCWETKFSDPDTSIYYGKQAISLAERQGLIKSKATALNTLSFTYYFQGNIREGIELLKQAVIIDSIRQDTLRVAAAKNKLGAFYGEIAENQKSIKASLESAEIYEAKKMYKNAGYCFTNIGGIYYDMNLYKQAKEYYGRAMNCYKNLNDPISTAGVFTNLSSIELDLKNYQESQRLSLRAIELIGDDETRLDLLRHSYYGLGNAKLYQREYEQAIPAFKKALSIGKQMNDQLAMVAILNDLALTYIHSGQLNLAKSYLDSVTDLVEIAPSVQGLMNVYGTSSQYYQAMGDADKTFEFYKKKFDLRDSTMTAESQSKIADLEVKYNLQEKELSIAKLNEEKAEASLLLARQQNWIISLVASIVLLGALASFLVYRRRKRAQQKLTEAELGFRKKLIKNTVNSQEDERKRIAKELHDGIAQSLVAVKMRFEYNLLAKEKAGDSETEDDKKALDLIESLYQEVRGLSHQMMPLKLTNQGLLSAMEELLENTLKPVGINFSFEHNLDTSKRLTEHIEIALFRISQELVANILKHSKADKVHLKLTQNADLVHLTVEDNGVGMKASPEKEGIGLASIMARVKALNGKVEWIKPPVGGLQTQLVIQL